MNNIYTIDETYLENKLGLYNVKNIEIIEYITLFKQIIHSNNPDKNKLIELFFDILKKYNKIETFLIISTSNESLLENIFSLNNDDLFNKVISLYEENNLTHNLVIDKINLFGYGYDNTTNSIFNCLLMTYINSTDNILTKLSEILDKYYISELIKNENYNKLIQVNDIIFLTMRSNRVKLIENIIDIYIKHNILQYLTYIYPNTSHGSVNIINSIFTYKDIIDNLSDNSFEQLINYTFIPSNYNYMYLAENVLNCEKYNQNDEINERYLILYTKLKDKIGMDNILNILCKYKVYQKLIDYIIHNINHDIKKAE